MVGFTKQNIAQHASRSYDVGLREYMIKVFNYMCLALTITGASSFAAIATPLRSLFFNEGFAGMTSLGTMCIFAPLVFVFIFAFKLRTMSASTAKICLFTYSALMGVSLASIFLMYTAESIARVFFITASVFASMSIYGYTTKRDLTSLGSFLFMGLIGIIIASLVNLFLNSPAVYFITSVLSVLIFTGFTAYDVQKIAGVYRHLPSGEAKQKAAAVGALTLYLDFINLFLSLLRLFGDRR